MEELVRDLTSVENRSKSKVRRLVQNFINQELQRQKDEMISALKRLPVFEVTDDVKREDGEWFEFFEKNVVPLSDLQDAINFINNLK